MDTNNQNNQNQYDQNTYTQSSNSYNQNPYQQNAYGQDAYSQNTYYQQPYSQQQPAKDETVSVLDWIGTYLIMIIPCVGLIMYIVWAFSSTTKKSKSNFCKAYLIMALVGLVIYFIFFIIFFMVAGVNYADMASGM